MAQTRIFCNYDTGDDGTGDGSLGNPYKTIQHAVDQLSTAGDLEVGVMADEPISTTIDLDVPNTSNDYMLSIIGVDSSGNELSNGTRRKLDGQGTCDYCFNSYGTSYPWKFASLDIDDFTEYVFNCISNYLYYPIFSNMKFQSCKGLLGTSLGIGYPMYISCHFYNLSGGYVLYQRGGSLINCLFENCTAGGISQLISTSSPIIIDGLVIKNCAAGYRILGPAAYTRNMLITDCTVGYGSYADILYLNGGVHSDILLRNISKNGGTGATTHYISYSVTYPTILQNCKYYNITDLDPYLAYTGTLNSYSFDQLTEDPLNSNLSMKESYTYRRYAETLGGYNGSLEVL